MTQRAGWMIGLAAAGLLAGCGDKAKAPAAADAGKPATAKVETLLDAASMPKRKAGLWLQTVSTGTMKQASKFCTDAAVEGQLGVIGQGMSKDMCSKIEMRRKLDGSIAFSSVCAMGGSGTTTTDGVMSGDFNSAYKMTATSTTTGAAAEQMNGVHAMTMEAVYQGPCPAGFKPGDMEVNGMKFNVASMAHPK